MWHLLDSINNLSGCSMTDLNTVQYIAWIDQFSWWATVIRAPLTLSQRKLQNAPWNIFKFAYVTFSPISEILNAVDTISLVGTHYGSSYLGGWARHKVFDKPYLFIGT